MYKFGLLTLFSVLITLSAIAQPEGFEAMKNTEAFKEKLNEVALSTTTIKSDFTQQKHLSFMEEDLVSEGKFWFKNGNMLRWEYVKPYSYLIVLNNNKVLIKDNNKVSNYDTNSNPAFKKINDLMVDCVQGTVLNNPDYKFRFFENKNRYLVEMTPSEKEVQEFLQTIFIYFDKKDHQVSEFKMLEKSGDYTSIRFSNKALNENIPAETFVVR